LTQEHWFEGKLSDPYNVLYARLDDNVHLRFHFDGGVFFWRQEAPDLPEPHSSNEYRLVEIPAARALRGRRVEAVAFSGVEGGGRQLEVAFAGGGAMILQNVDDTTKLSIRGENDT
jgi:hypothetical protein